MNHIGIYIRDHRQVIHTVAKGDGICWIRLVIFQDLFDSIGLRTVFWDQFTINIIAVSEEVVDMKIFGQFILNIFKIGSFWSKETDFVYSMFPFIKISGMILIFSHLICFQDGFCVFVVFKLFIDPLFPTSVPSTS